jgi:hypothetical protein
VLTNVEFRAGDARSAQLSNRWPLGGECDRAGGHGAWGRGFLPSGSLLERDELVRFAGYQTQEDWKFRSLMVPSLPLIDMEEVYRLFDHRCRSDLALAKLAKLRRRVRRFKTV